MALNDIYRATVLQTLDGQAMMNVLHYRLSTVGSGNVQDALAAIMDSTIGAALKAHLPDDVFYESVTAQKIYPLPVTFPSVNGTTSGFGTVAVTAFPTEVCAVITKRTALAGPRRRGRAYISGLGSTYVTESMLNATGQTEIGPIGTAMTQVLNGANGNVFTPIIWHRDLLTYDDVTGVVIRTTLRAQRRRQVGRGI
jgi:hypothetical protein